MPEVRLLKVLFFLYRLSTKGINDDQAETRAVSGEMPQRPGCCEHCNCCRKDSRTPPDISIRHLTNIRKIEPYIYSGGLDYPTHPRAPRPRRLTLQCSFPRIHKRHVYTVGLSSTRASFTATAPSLTSLGHPYTAIQPCQGGANITKPGPAPPPPPTPVFFLLGKH